MRSYPPSRGQASKPYVPKLLQGGPEREREESPGFPMGGLSYMRVVRTEGPSFRVSHPATHLLLVAATAVAELLLQAGLFVPDRSEVENHSAQRAQEEHPWTPEYDGEADTDHDHHQVQWGSGVKA